MTDRVAAFERRWPRPRGAPRSSSWTCSAPSSSRARRWKSRPPATWSPASRTLLAAFRAQRPARRLHRVPLLGRRAAPGRRAPPRAPPRGARRAARPRPAVVLMPGRARTMSPRRRPRAPRPTSWSCDKPTTTPSTAPRSTARSARAGVTTLVITGTMTDICVLATVVGGFNREYRITVVEDGWPRCGRRSSAPRWTSSGAPTARVQPAKRVARRALEPRSFAREDPAMSARELRFHGCIPANLLPFTRRPRDRRARLPRAPALARRHAGRHRHRGQWPCRRGVLAHARGAQARARHRAGRGRGQGAGDRRRLLGRHAARRSSWRATRGPPAPRGSSSSRRRSSCGARR